jgi:aspartate kinase
VVAEADGIRALQVVHAAFSLGGDVVHQAQGTESPIEASNGRG